MGRAKQWYMEQMERGYSEADGAVCPDCVSDYALEAWVEDNLTENECTFCEASGSHPIAASFDGFVGQVMEGIGFDWNHPDDEGIMYVSAEGGYQANVSDIWEVLADYEIDNSGDVVDAMIDVIDDNGWVERGYYHGNETTQSLMAWQWFKYVTKHQTRYLFLSEDPDDDRTDIPPSQMLNQITSILFGRLEDRPVRTIEQGARFFRVRVDDVEHSTASALGAPPLQYANQPNRMSPAGIPMFYGAFEPNTAIVETLDVERKDGKILSIGEFVSLRDLTLLDLTMLPDIPSVFDARKRHLIRALRFAHSFTADLVEPIPRDGREHIEYVPTQIVTEYFRRVFRDESGGSLDGIVYQSSRDGGDKAIVLFCENEQAIDESGSIIGMEPVLKLVGVQHQKA